MHADGTTEIAKALGVTVKIQKGTGYGRAIVEAIPYARGDILVFIDGDGVYDPREIPKLLKVMKKEKADLVIGSRFRGEVKPGTTPFLRLMANKLLNLFFGLLLRRPITDAFSGFIVAKKMTLSRIERLPGLGAEPALHTIIAEVSLKQGKVVEAPITFYPRIGKYKLSPLSAGIRILLSTLKLVSVRGRFG